MSLEDQKMTEQLSFLPNKKFPIIFHATRERHQLLGTSSYNEAEIDICYSYIAKLFNTTLNGKKLTQWDIGVITPYNAQLKKL